MGKYESHVEPKLFLVESWARDGLKDEQIAKNLGVAYSTFREYKKSHVALSAALKKGKEVVDYEVQNALFEKCIGRFVKEEVAFKCKRVFWDEAGRRCEEEEIKTTMVEKYIPPDTMAQLAWMNNRCGDRWRRNAGKERLDERKFEHEKKVDEKKNW